MILTLVGNDKYFANFLEPTGMVLNDMVSEVNILIQYNIFIFSFSFSNLEYEMRD